MNTLDKWKKSSVISLLSTLPHSAYNHIMTAPSIESSTREERLDYVLNEWKCLHNCELCGRCHVLKGRSEETLYADYIDGKRSYMDITLGIRSNR